MWIYAILMLLLFYAIAFILIYINKKFFYSSLYAAPSNIQAQPLKVVHMVFSRAIDLFSDALTFIPLLAFNQAMRISIGSKHSFNQ